MTRGHSSDWLKWDSFKPENHSLHNYYYYSSFSLTSLLLALFLQDKMAKKE